MSSLRTTGLVAGLVFVLAACGSGVAVASDGQESEAVSAGPLVFTVDDVSGDEALAEGQLSIEDCALLITPDFRSLLLVWPPDRATHDSDQNQIEFIQPDQSTFVLEDQMQVGVGGSIAELSNLSLASGIDSACTFDDVWVVTSFL